MKVKLYLSIFITICFLVIAGAQSASINGDFETFTDLTPVYNEVFETDYPAGTSVAPEGYLSITRFSLLVFEYVIFGVLPVGDELDRLFEGASGLAEIDGGANGSAKSVALTGDEFFAGSDLFGAFAAQSVGSTFSGYYRFEGQDNGEDTLFVMSIYDANTFLPQDFSELSMTSAFSLDTLLPNGSTDFTFFEAPIIANPNGGATDTVNIFLLAFLDSTAIANGNNNRFIVDQLGFDQDPANECGQDGGQIGFADGSTETTICAGDGLSDALDVTLAGTVADNTAWVITDDAGIILELPMAPPFDLDAAPAGTCLIWHLAFEDGLSGAEVGANANDLMGCFDLSNPLTVIRNRPDAGVIAFAVGVTETTICAGDGTADPLDVVVTDADAANAAWVITDEAGMILELPMAPPFDLDDAPDGTCLIWHLAFEDGLIGAEVGANANDLMGCFNLSNPLTVIRNRPDAGMIAFADGSTETAICAGDGTADPLDVVVTDTNAANAAWVITDEAGMILELPMAPPFDLDAAPAGTCLIWHLAFEDGLSGAAVGASAGDLMGCFNLSNPLTVVRNRSEGGAISLSDGTTMTSICVADNVLDTVSVLLTGTMGLNQTFVITDTDGIILELATGPDIAIEGTMAETRLIWSLAFADDLQGAEIGANANDLTGCFSLSNAITVTLEVDGSTCTSSNEEILDATNLVHVYPNPTSGQVNVDISQEVGSITSAQVISMDGRLLNMPFTAKGEYSLEVNLGGQPSGVYILQLTTTEGIMHKAIQVR